MGRIIRNRFRRPVGVNLTMAEAAYAFKAIFGRKIEKDDAERYKADLKAIWDARGVGVLDPLATFNVEDFLAGRYDV